MQDHCLTKLIGNDHCATLMSQFAVGNNDCLFLSLLHRNMVLPYKQWDKTPSLQSLLPHHDR